MRKYLVGLIAQCWSCGRVIRPGQYAYVDSATPTGPGHKYCETCAGQAVLA